MKQIKSFEQKTIHVQDYRHGVNLVNYLTRQGYKMPRFNRTARTVTFNPYDRQIRKSHKPR